MKGYSRQIGVWGILITLFTLHSCILKEFNFNENKLDTDWKMQLVAPLFYGDMEFKDFIHNWRSPIHINATEPVIQLKFESDSVIPFPTRLISQPEAIIDSFGFLIEGDDYLSKATFKYTVTNESPFPLSLQMRFFEKHLSADQNPAIVPPPFPAAKYENGTLTPVKTEYTLALTSAQLESFKVGNRVEFVSWFGNAIPGFKTDTLSAHYPIHLSIVLSGVIHGYHQ